MIGTGVNVRILAHFHLSGGFERSSHHAVSVMIEAAGKALGRVSPVQGFARAEVSIERRRDEVLRRVAGKVCAFREILSEKSIGILIGSAPGLIGQDGELPEHRRRDDMPLTHSGQEVTGGDPSAPTRRRRPVPRASDTVSDDGPGQPHDGGEDR